MSTTVIVGTWLAAGLTLCIYSFLYKDNVFYKIAEHIYVGISAAYIAVVVWYDVIMAILIRPLFYGNARTGEHSYILIVPAILGLLMLSRFSKKYGWLSRIPLSLLFGMGAGLVVTAQTQGFIIPQVKATIINPPIIKVGTLNIKMDKPNYSVLIGGLECNKKRTAELNLDHIASGMHKVIVIDKDAKKTVFAKAVPIGYGTTTEVEIKNTGGAVLTKIAASQLPKPAGRKNTLGFPIGKSLFFNLDVVLILIGVASTLVYFYFSTPHTGVVGKIARVGVWFIMVSFGASFGYTVMARISLLIGRIQFLLVDWLHIIE